MENMLRRLDWEQSEMRVHGDSATVSRESRQVLLGRVEEGHLDSLIARLMDQTARLLLSLRDERQGS